MKLELREDLVLHILALTASHDYRVCRHCAAIVTQINWFSWHSFENLGGRGGTPPQPMDTSAEHDPYDVNWSE